MTNKNLTKKVENIIVINLAGGALMLTGAVIAITHSPIMIITTLVGLIALNCTGQMWYITGKLDMLDELQEYNEIKPKKVIKNDS